MQRKVFRTLSNWWYQSWYPFMFN